MRMGGGNQLGWWKAISQQRRVVSGEGVEEGG